MQFFVVTLLITLSDSMIGALLIISLVYSNGLRLFDQNEYKLFHSESGIEFFYRETGDGFGGTRRFIAVKNSNGFRVSR
jgi:hypothetical protein